QPGAEPAEADELQGLLRAGDRLPLDPADLRPADPGDGEVEGVAGDLAVIAEEDVLQHRHPCREGDVLEGPGDAQPDDLVGVGREKVATVELDRPSGGSVEPRHNVEE